MTSIIQFLSRLNSKNTVSHDNYEKELDCLKKEHLEEQLSVQISQLINKLADILSEDKPYPFIVIQTIDDLRMLMDSISTHSDNDYFNHCVELSRKWIINQGVDMLDPTILTNRKILYDSFSKDGKIDLDRIQTTLLDKYFLTFTDYWEKTISELKRKNAIINRREYLIELTQKFVILLTEKGITKYNQELLDYRNLNFSLLESLKK